MLDQHFLTTTEFPDDELFYMDDKELDLAVDPSQATANVCTSCTENFCCQCLFHTIYPAETVTTQSNLPLSVSQSQTCHFHTVIAVVLHQSP